MFYLNQNTAPLKTSLIFRLSLFLTTRKQSEHPKTADRKSSLREEVDEPCSRLKTVQVSAQTKVAITERNTVNPEKRGDWSTRITTDNVLRESSIILQLKA